MRLRSLLPLAALLAAAACGHDEAPAARSGAATATPAAGTDAGRPDAAMQVTVDTQRVEPAGAEETQSPEGTG